MSLKQIILAEEDERIITNFIDHYATKDEITESSISRLRTEIKKAKILPSNLFPKQVIRLNSKFDLDTPNGLMPGYQLVLPAYSNFSLKRLSVLSPMGLAVIGYAQNDEIEWTFPGGEKKIKIVYVDNTETF